MASSSIDSEDIRESPANPGRDEEAIREFLEACRHVQTQAAALCANSALPELTRETLKDLRLRLLAARKVMLSPEAADSSGKTADASEGPLFRRPPPPNPLAPSSKPSAR